MALPTTAAALSQIDENIDFPQISQDLWREKYAWNGEKDINETALRVCKGVHKFDAPHLENSLNILESREFCPGGRILAGAGTDKHVTLKNCYVADNIEDSLDGIMDILKEGAKTQQMGGGIGYNFSTIRPRGALVKRTQSISTGVLPFMDMFNAMCQTIRSSGSRRGAQMAVLADWHPDLLEFIDAKNETGRLTNFNMSVLVSDKLMEAVKKDQQWFFKFPKPNELHKNPSPTGEYLYKFISARDLWNKIIRNTYEHAEPGVLFIDHVNKMNNLWWCEKISCVNPCGEQFLPANDSCNLGAINLAQMVENPFYSSSKIKFQRLRDVVHHAIRFLDNIIDITNYPTVKQSLQAARTRRIGLGVMGLGTMLQMLGIRYGSDEALETTENVMRVIRDEAYWASIMLGKERGSFPILDRKRYLEGNFINTLTGELKDAIMEHGIRNSLLTTIAPTGNTSIYYGNVSSGLEPSFSWEYIRKVLQQDSSKKEYKVQDYGYRLFKELHPSASLPNYFVTALELTVDAHLEMQAACQKYIDNSISKTINCPKDISYDDFKHVYERAYDLGLKGCTTYRPSDVRGSVLEVPQDPSCPNGLCSI